MNEEPIEFTLEPWHPMLRAYPRGAIPDLVPSKDFLWISITDPGKSYVRRPIACGTPNEGAPKCLARLCLSFWDAEDVNQMPGGFWTQNKPPPALPLAEQDLFQPWQAQRIVEWLTTHWGEANLLILNCEGGLSRSPSMAATLAHLFGNRNGTWGSKLPSTRIPTLLLAAAKEIGLP